VVKLDRLGRNTRDVLNLVHEPEQKGASLRVLEPGSRRLVGLGDEAMQLQHLMQRSQLMMGSLPRVAFPFLRNCR